MPELRLTRFGYDYCCECSTEKPKVGRITTMGQGDHTWTEIEILDQDIARKLSDLEKNRETPEDIDMESEDSEEVLQTLQKVAANSYLVDIDEEYLQEKEEEEDPELSVLDYLEAEPLEIEE